MSTTDETIARHYEQRWLILALVGLGQLMLVLDFTIVNVALPSAQADLEFSADVREWIVTAYTLAVGSLLLFGGRLCDLFGSKWALSVGFLGFAAASAVGGAAPSFGMLVAARVAQGVFGALLAPALLAVLTTTFTEPAERGKAFGIFGALAGTGGVVGVVLGGVLTQTLSWRWVLYVNLAFAVPAAIMALRLLVNQTPSSRRPLDLVGALTATGGLFALLYGFSNAQRHTWADATTLAALAGGILLLVAFQAIESHAADPLLPLRLLADRTRAGSYLAIALIFIGLFSALLFLTYYLQGIRGWTPIETGLAFLPQLAATVLTAIIVNSKLLHRVGSRPLLALGLALSAISMLWLAQLDIDSSYAVTILPALTVLGAGLGAIVGSAPDTATSGVDSTDSGVASAMVDTSQAIGGAIGLAVLSTLAGTAANPQASVDGYTTAFYVAAGILLVGSVLTDIITPSVRIEPESGHT